MKTKFKEKITKKNIILAVVVIIAVGYYIYHTYSNQTGSTSLTSTTSTETTIDENVVYTSKDPTEALKNTTLSGTFTDEEKAKIVELTDTLAKIMINNDYQTDTVDTLKTFVNYMDDDLKSKYTDDILQSQIDNLVNNEHIAKLQDVTYTKITRDENNDLVAVNFTATVRVVNDTNSAESGKTFSDVECGFAFDKDWKLSQFAEGPYQ